MSKSLKLDIIHFYPINKGESDHILVFYKLITVSNPEISPFLKEDRLSKEKFNPVCRSISDN